ncbi:MAG: radical SAM family heme chaperone HemW [Bacillota bacterium]|nr:radical SAM family heme chaperone HemW [Bacillota bacterium]
MYLYLHVPFCSKKCNYCDFVTFGEVSRQDEYTDLLVKEIEILSKRYPKVLKTLYLGGGTPSLLSEKNLEKIYRAVVEHFELLSEEVTIEMNPEDCSFEKLKHLRDLGFNRASIGIQSFSDRILGLIGRVGNRELSIRAYENARKAGFHNISLDLIYGIPTQTPEELQDSIDKIIELSPDHISTYSLMINKGTKLYSDWKKKKWIAMDDDIVADQFDLIVERFARHGYHRYEISNFARESFEAIHNSAYWNMDETLGAGISAVYTRRKIRVENTYSYQSYVKAIHSGELPILHRQELSEKDEISERIMMGFRLSKGIDYGKLNREFSIDFLEMYKDQIQKYIDLKYMSIKDGRIFLNNEGMNISNSIVSDFIL